MKARKPLAKRARINDDVTLEVSGDSNEQAAKKLCLMMDHDYQIKESPRN